MTDDTVASNETEFWERRHDLTLSPITEKDIEQRAIGRIRHVVLLAHITDETIVSRFGSILKRLGDFNCIAPIRTTNLHITGKVFGNVVEEPNGEGEFSKQDERELATSLQSALCKTIPFTASFPRFNIFPGVVYAEVVDDGHFATVNHRVCERSDTPVWNRDRGGFIPHLTLGHIIQRSGYEHLLQYLERNRSLAIPSTTIEELKLVALDLSDGRFPQYETIEIYDLS